MHRKILTYCVCVPCFLVLAYLWPGLVGMPDVLPQIFLERFWRHTATFGAVGLLAGILAADWISKISRPGKNAILLCLVSAAGYSIISLVQYYKEGLFW